MPQHVTVSEYNSDWPRKYAEEREKITLLAENAHILWAVGYRISEYYKITSQTKRVLEVHVKGVKEDE